MWSNDTKSRLRAAHTQRHNNCSTSESNETTYKQCYSTTSTTLQCGSACYDFQFDSPFDPKMNKEENLSVSETRSMTTPTLEILPPQPAAEGEPTTPVPTSGPGSRSATPLTGRYSKANEAKADTLFDRARHGIHCSLFCGGVRCKHEDWQLFKTRKNVHPAIEGLNSNWVGDLVIASQRPATSLFLKYMLIPQFKTKNVTGVFNLQEKESMPARPDGIYANCGYSYSGEQDLMRHGLRYYEFPWPDMTAPDNDIVLRVQVMDSHVQGSGRSLHCHAGLGRTGLLIACYFVYAISYDK